MPSAKRQERTEHRKQKYGKEVLSADGEGRISSEKSINTERCEAD